MRYRLKEGMTLTVIDDRYPILAGYTTFFPAGTVFELVGHVGGHVVLSEGTSRVFMDRKRLSKAFEHLWGDTKLFEGRWAVEAETTDDQ